jgi:hypothetical protein
MRNNHKFHALVDEIIDVCESCYGVYNYGIDGYEYPSDSTTDLAPLEKISADYVITDMSFTPRGERHMVFSKFPCDGCGSLLAGSRWALLVSEITV